MGVIFISQLKLIIDNDVLEKYFGYYFDKYPKRKKKPIDSPLHPSINKWMIMKRPQMNDVKQKYKEFITWFVEDQGHSNKKIQECSMTFVSYFKTKARRDLDNTVPKFMLDGLIESGLIVDDDYFHLKSLTLEGRYDKERPRTEIHIFY